ncbi:MAG: A24 family peptidase, partial [Salinisphaera sp.]|nr:A24 family peptidase [Salinisphaera sp.]
LGWQQLPLLLLLASATGAITGLLLMAGGRMQRGRAMPFGPFLAAAGWLTLIAGDTMLQTYFALAGFS